MIRVDLRSWRPVVIDKKVTLLILAVVCFVETTAMAREATIDFAFAMDSPPASFIGQSSNMSEGIFPELIVAVFEEMPLYKASFESYPWKRAQAEVKIGRKDALCTYPSDARKEYLNFVSTPLYIEDYGYLIFSKRNSRSEYLSKVTKVSDLGGLRLVSERGTGWEDDNIPGYIERIYVSNVETKIHYILRRDVGDLFIMNLEQATYFARKFGYEDRLAFKQVDFIPDSLIPFHIGIRKSLEGHEAIIKLIENVQSSENFKLRKQKIMRKYRH